MGERGGRERGGGRERITSYMYILDTGIVVHACTCTCTCINIACIKVSVISISE